MSLEKPTTEQLKISESTELSCQQSLAQKIQQESTEMQKKAKEELDKAMQQLSQIPEQVIKGLDDSIKLLLSAVNGFVDTNDPQFKPELMITTLESLLKPVLSFISVLPIPSIPGLVDIQKLLDALKSFITSMSSEAKSDDNTAISSQLSANASAAVQQVASQVQSTTAGLCPELRKLMTDLLAALQSLCTTLPMVLINLVFQMIGKIVGMFEQIAKIIGVPSIPYPLNLVSQCITMTPKLIEFVLNIPSQVVNTTWGLLEKAYGKITSLQVPSAPDDIDIPKKLPTCPVHSSAENSNSKEKAENSN